MSRPRDDREKDLLRPALDEIVDLDHPLVRLAEKIDGNFLHKRFSSVCQAGSGQGQRDLYLTVFDQLNPAYAKYYTTAKARELLARVGLVDVALNHCNGYSWVVAGNQRCNLALRPAESPANVHDIGFQKRTQGEE